MTINRPVCLFANEAGRYLTTATALLEGLRDVDRCGVIVAVCSSTLDICNIRSNLHHPPFQLGTHEEAH